jgi:hypothetical protein
MRKKFLLLTLLWIVIFTLVATPATAQSIPQDVSIYGITIIPPDGFPYGWFFAEGPAVEAGLICAEGETLDLETFGTGWQGDRGINFHARKLLTCSDGSGDFILNMQVRVDIKGDNANWNVLEGTGNYEELRGAGKMVGYFMEWGVLDVYTGKLH